jgi:chromate reductase
MSETRKVGVLLGSLRKKSISSSLSMALQKLAPSHLKFSEVLISDLPLYNSDQEDTLPASWVRLRQEVAAYDALLFITPEYNRSIPGGLKNAIDIGSRPKGQSVFDGKPAAIITFSPGNLGGFCAHHHLRDVFLNLNMPTLPAPEIYLNGAAKIVNDEGGIDNPDTKKLLDGVMHEFSKWIELIKSR